MRIEPVEFVNDDHLLAKMLEQQSDLFREWGEEEVAADLLKRSSKLRDEMLLTDTPT